MAAGAYLAGMFPGGDTLNIEKAKTALFNMIEAHALAYDAIKQADTTDADGDGEAAIVSFVHSAIPMFPARNDSKTRAAAERYDYFYNRIFFEALVSGLLDLNLDGDIEDEGEGSHDELAGRMDYVGFSYYGRQAVIYSKGTIPPIDARPCPPPLQSLCRFYDPEAERGTNGNEVYPDGIAEAVREFGGYGLPVVVLENGVATEDGEFRARFIIKHLFELRAVMDEGYDVRGYLYWSLIDNFEWLDGFNQRFGLYTVDFETFERTINKGGEAYREIVRANGLTEELIGRMGGGVDENNAKEPPSPLGGQLW